MIIKGRSTSVFPQLAASLTRCHGGKNSGHHEPALVIAAACGSVVVLVIAAACGGVAVVGLPGGVVI